MRAYSSKVMRPLRGWVDMIRVTAQSLRRSLLTRTTIALWLCLLVHAVTGCERADPPGLPSATGTDPKTLQEAAYLGDLGKLKYYLDSGASINDPDQSGFTALHWAAIESNHEAAAILLDHGAFVDAVRSLDVGYLLNTHKLRPLHLASLEGDKEMVAMLLGAGADPTHPFDLGLTALHLAASRGDVEIAKLLIEAGADVDALAYHDSRAGLAASLFGQSELAAGYTPVFLAAQAGHDLFVELLLSYGADPSICSPHVKLDGVDQSTATTTRSLALLANGSDYADSKRRSPPPQGAKIVRFLRLWQFDRGTCAVHEAAMNGHHRSVKALLNAGVPVDAPDRSGLSAMCYAAWHAKVATIELLLDSGASAMFSTAEGVTPLHFAAASGSPDTVSILLSHMGDSSLSTHPSTALAVDAMTTSHFEISTAGSLQLGVARVDPSEIKTLKIPHGSTALHIAASVGDAESVQLLLSAGSSASAKDAVGMTPMNRAADGGHVSIVNILRDAR